MTLHLPSHIVQRIRLIKDKYGTPFVVRLYQHEEKDYPALKEMYNGFEPKEWSQGIPPRVDERREEWVRYVADEGVNLLALLEERVVGHAALFEMEPGKGCEYLVFVHQEYQDRGIGTALTQLMCGLAREVGLNQIWLTVETRNFKAIHVYEKVGFCFVGPRDIECVMRLSLCEDDEGA